MKKLLLEKSLLLPDNTTFINIELTHIFIGRFVALTNSGYYIMYMINKKSFLGSFTVLMNGWVGIGWSNPTGNDKKIESFIQKHFQLMV